MVNQGVEIPSENVARSSFRLTASYPHVTLSVALSGYSSGRSFGLDTV